MKGLIKQKKYAEWNEQIYQAASVSFILIY